ncbi:MAG: hypothetical protein KBD05_01690 [Candidatus Pacebacteria bacterium]|nr:hypothetical protein [Candidatus Paceibacterota bacterium]
MELTVEVKNILAIASTIVGLVSFAPYLWQILKRETKPHAYTWLIWTITQGIVAAGIWFGGGGILAFAMVLYALCALTVFILSFWYGTKNITRGDGILLLVAIAAIFVWQGLDNPVLAVIIATAIDLIGYAPTFRKSFSEPWSENILAWIGYTLSPIVALFSIVEYNLMTTSYAAAVAVINTALVVFLLMRRQKLTKP